MVGIGGNWCGGRDVGGEELVVAMGVVCLVYWNKLKNSIQDLGMCLWGDGSHGGGLGSELNLHPSPKWVLHLDF